jgi:hypothetical protein
MITSLKAILYYNHELISSLYPVSTKKYIFTRHIQPSAATRAGYEILYSERFSQHLLHFVGALAWPVGSQHAVTHLLT